MRLRLASDQILKLKTALKREGKHEIGGQLFGEQLAPSDFRITELTVQRRLGTVARFIVDLLQAARDAMRFFDRTQHRYTRFNYIGEWHSHPNYAVQPSATDVETMRQLVHDPTFQGRFAVLTIARLDNGAPKVGAWLFDSKGVEGQIDLEIIHD